MNEKDIEDEIVKKKLNKPSLTPDLIDAVIVQESYHVFESTQLTVCCLTLQNGFNVVGESACASPDNFNEELGKKISREKARSKIWVLEGYLLKQILYEASQT